MRDDHQRRYAALVDRTGLTPEEVGAWSKAADSMHVPFDEARGINPQDSTFLDKKPWDFEGTPREKYPLLLHYHPLVIYRHKVIKQADIVLAMFLLNREFSADQKRRNFDYYDPLTTGDSSLSACIQSIVAWELGYYEKAWEYLWFAALTDLSNTGGNVRDGAHLASIGGTWMAVVHGIAGMRDWGGQLAFRPHTWGGLKRLRFPVCWRNQRIDVELGPESVSYCLRKGAALTIRHRDQPVELSAGTPVTFPLETGSSSST
jgi:alpha,alpha-trehalose phosphorylase